jgi:opacity protein-like surface antigen
MFDRILAILSIAALLLAAAAAAAGEPEANVAQYLTGLAAEPFAVHDPALDGVAKAEESGDSLLSRLDLQPLRARLESGTESQTGSEAGASSRMLQLYYDVAGEAAWRPYLGAGVGFANVRPNELTCMTLCSSLGDADRSIGYQFMAGVTYELKKDVTFFAEHRLSGLARGSLVDTDGARTDVEGLRDRAFGGGVRIGF